MKKQEVKYFRFKLEDGSISESGSFRGYASIWGVLDSYGDIVERGAFRKTLKEKKGRKIKLLWSHNAGDPPIGYLVAAEDDHGLYVEGQLFLEANQKAREVYAAMKAGVLDGISIGYRTVKDAVDNEAGVRRLKEVELYEISICNFQACPGAVVTGVKSLDDLAGCVEALRDERLSDEQKKDLAQYIDSLKALLPGEPPPADTPPGNEPPIADSGQKREAVEAVKSLVEWTRGQLQK